MKASQLYDKDFYAWVYDTVGKLKLKKFNEIDLDNVIEEIEGLARSDYRELIIRLKVLIAHLLKWQLQPDKRSSSWRGTIIEQRQKINSLLTDSPSLKYKLFKQVDINELYKGAKNIFYKDTGLDIEKLLVKNPFTIEEILDDNFYPMSN